MVSLLSGLVTYPFASVRSVLFQVLLEIIQSSADYVHVPVLDIDESPLLYFLLSC